MECRGVVAYSSIGTYVVSVGILGLGRSANRPVMRMACLTAAMVIVVCGAVVRMRIEWDQVVKQNYIYCLHVPSLEYNCTFLS